MKFAIEDEDSKVIPTYVLAGAAVGCMGILAETIGCQVSHITNVLSGSGHFNEEQAESAARFFGLNLHETEFFLLLIQYVRAGTTSLKKFYERILL